MGEKQPLHSVGAVLFLGFSFYVALAGGMDAGKAAAQMGGAAVAGYVIGEIVRALNLGGAAGGASKRK